MNNFPELTSYLIAVLQLVAAPGFGGYVGSWLFDKCREWFPSDRASDDTPRWQRPIYRAIWLKAYTPWVTKLFTFAGGMVSAAAAAFLAYLAGNDIMLAVDQSVAMLISGVFAIGWGETRHQAQKKAQEESPWQG